MKQERYKKLYEKEYKRVKQLIKFIEMLESSTDYFDDLCDCPVADGQSEDGIHFKGCRTTFVRYDYNQLFLDKKSKRR